MAFQRECSIPVSLKTQLSIAPEHVNPFHLMENRSRCLENLKSPLATSHIDDDRKYADEILEAVYFYGEINPDDAVCCMGPRRCCKGESLKADVISEQLKRHSSLKTKPGRPRNTPSYGEDRYHSFQRESGCFDKIFMCECSSHIEDKAAFFSMIHSHLAPVDGILLLIDRLTSRPEFTPDGRYRVISSSIKDDIGDTISILLASGFDVEWDVITIPLTTTFTQWLQRLQSGWEDSSQPTSELQQSDFLVYINRMLAGPLKYLLWDQNGTILLHDQLFVTVVRPRIPRGSTQLSVRRCRFSFNNRIESSEKLKKKVGVPFPIFEPTRIVFIQHASLSANTEGYTVKCL